jgi:hypothetical protein
MFTQTEMKQSSQTGWRRFFKPLVSALGAEQQTKASWSRVIESYADVPPLYQTFFDPLIADKRPLPYSVFVPSCEGFLRRATEHLVCDFGSEICILKRHGDTFTAESYPLAGISYLETGTVLLDSWIKISGTTSQGVPSAATLRFNTVTEELFAPFLNKIRYAPRAPEAWALNPEADKFNRFGKLNYKLMNYARRSLLVGEKEIHTVLQSEIRAILLRFLGKTYDRTTSTAHVSILTDKELIIIQENGKWTRGARYGGTWHYIPLNKIAGLSLSEKADHLVGLSIRLFDEAPLEMLFEPSALPEVDLLVEQFGKLAAH